MGNIVAIIGRPNVGKSTFFNRLTKSRDAIEDPTSGVTRDRHYGKSDWNGKHFSIIDTGGYVVGSEDVFETEIRAQVSIAMEEADCILFLVDVQEGITPLDKEIANLLRRTKKKVYVVGNKVDHHILENHIHEFYELGLGEIYPVSAINGSGTGDLLDELVLHFPEIPEDVPEENLPKFTVVGRPNVGKSSLINALVGEERNIVTNIAGTTRDSIYSRYSKFNFDFYLVDTAGLRKKGKVHENIEFYSVLRSIRSIEKSDVCILMIDATQGFEAQDLNILRLIEKNNKGVVIVVNKWDLIEKDSKTHLQFEKAIREKIAPFKDIQIVFTSVHEKQRILKVFEAALQAYKNRSKRIATSKLNEKMLAAIEYFHPPVVKDKMIQIKYVTQLPADYPMFAFFCNLPQYIRTPYKNYLENKIREYFEFTGVPITIYFRKK